MPQTAHGQIEVLIGDLTQKTVSGLAFRPGAVFFLARAKNTAHLGDAWGVITANGQVGRWGQFSHGTHQEDGVSSSRARNQFGVGQCVFVRIAQFGADHIAVATITADGFQYQPTTSDVDVDVYWFAVDEDVGIACTEEAESFGGTTAAYVIRTDAAAFVPDFIASHPYMNTTGATMNGGLDGFGVSDGARSISVDHYAQHVGTAASVGASFYDTDADAGAGAFRNNNQFSEGGLPRAPVVTTEHEPNGSLGVVWNRIFGSGATTRLGAIGFGPRGDGEAAWGRFTCPATAGGSVAVSLPFQPSFIKLITPLNITADSDGNDIPSTGQNTGICRGIWTAAGSASLSYVQAGDTTTTLNKVNSASPLSFPAPFTGTAEIVARADGFDVNFTGYSGESHQVLFVAVGEAGAPPETQLDTEDLTLGWTLDDATLTIGETVLDTDDLALGWALDTATLVQEEQPLTIDDLTLGWALQDVDVIAANIVAPDDLTLGWALEDVGVDVDIIVPDPMLFGFGIQAVNLVQEEQPLTSDALTLQWSLDTTDVIGQNVVAPENLALGWTLDDAGLVIDEQSLTPAFVALTWQLAPVTVQQAETALGVEPLTLSWSLDDAVLPVESIGPESLLLGWQLDFAQVYEAMPQEAVQLVKVLRPESAEVKVYSSYRGVKNE